MQDSTDWSTSSMLDYQFAPAAFDQPPPDTAPVEEQAPLVTIVQCASINVVHRLSSGLLTEEKNLQRYGRMAMSLHGHTLSFEVTFRGPVLRATGQMPGTGPLEDVMAMAVHEVLHNRNLDTDVPFFLSRPSTLENIALFVWRNLSVILSALPQNTCQVSVETTPCPRATTGPRAMSKIRVVYSGEMTTTTPSG
ncbi:uncharacterized protein RHOBADRAFT_56180 [Rhodotorula graminis WP1]|uniref:6-pyruvoyltetrahydropterin synthase n=1 Tax=Rhodotorula graminis (strain WP1) TaxID=578459 RepID=A0A0P9F8S3_RHOGW|nr:uncharacterized protein RHOBADRAFT_56180 [Rhodotorula graminis WP1]KPV72048.1 hypothetical protein RHOBADRAFT_56180 [Rhodotorula graminis WP1]